MSKPGPSIVVGTDGSSTATAVIEQARELGRALGATVHVVCAFKPPLAYGWELGGSYQFAREDASVIVGEAAQRLRADGLEVETHVVEGGAAEVLLDMAATHDARAIVVGSKGMSGTRRYMLGNVPNKVSHHASCNVLVVRTR